MDPVDYSLVTLGEFTHMGHEMTGKEPCIEHEANEEDASKRQ